MLGYIGQNVLGIASPSNTVGQDIGTLLLIGFVYKLAYFVLLWAKANKTNQIHQHASAASGSGAGGFNAFITKNKQGVPTW